MPDEIEEHHGPVKSDSTGRFVRYDVLEERAWKVVYKGYDEVYGTEVAWNEIKLSWNSMIWSEQDVSRLRQDSETLESLNHENVVKCHSSWVDAKSMTLTMITETFESGNLEHYLKRHKILDNKAVKKWAVQILKGLDYLHSRNPPVVHGNLDCKNIFVDGSSGKLKIGNIGLESLLKARCVSITPDFVAPELDEEDYNQLVDIYSFGMCVLQMVNKGLLPYSECKNWIEVMRKVCAGAKPESLSEVKDPLMKQFIEKCLAPLSERPAANELLDDPFLATTDSSIEKCSPPLTESVGSPVSPNRSPYNIDRQGFEGSSRANQIASSSGSVRELSKSTETDEKYFKLNGKMEADGVVSMTLWIVELAVGIDRMKFLLNLQTDTAVSVTEEMVEEFELANADAGCIHDLMEKLISELGHNYQCNLANAGILSHQSDQNTRGRLTLKISGEHEAESHSEHADLTDRKNPRCSRFTYFPPDSPRRGKTKLPSWLMKLLFCGTLMLVCTGTKWQKSVSLQVLFS